MKPLIRPRLIMRDSATDAEAEAAKKSIKQKRNKMIIPNSVALYVKRIEFRIVEVDE